jgi:hypothetical protein
MPAWSDAAGQDETHHAEPPRNRSPRDLTTPHPPRLSGSRENTAYQPRRGPPADAFLSSWGRAAYDLGWTALNLFGVHAIAPGSRYDVMGLVPLLGGGSVFALTEQTAAIRRHSGSTLTYTRKQGSGAVLLCGGHHAIG